MSEQKNKKITVSSIFMVPTLKIDEKYIKTHNFINGFSKDADKDEYDENVVFVLFKPKNMDSFQWFVDEEYDRTDAILEDYDIGTSGAVVLVYRLNSAFKADFDLVRQGKYSRTSKKFQELFKKTKTIVENGEHVDKMSLQWKIFTKAEDLRGFWEEEIGTRFKEDMEVWSEFSIEKETLTAEKIKELI